MAKLNANDEERHQRESTLNALESFVFETQNRLETDEYSSAVSPDEKQKILEAVSKVIHFFAIYILIDLFSHYILDLNILINLY